MNTDRKLKQKFKYFRYVDDILIIEKTAQADKALRHVSTQLEKLGLKTHEQGESGKTTITPVLKSVEYLGYKISPERTSVRKSSYRKMFTNLVHVFTEQKYRKNERQFVWRLNLKITGCVYKGARYGWVSFFSQVTHTSQFQRLDYFVRSELKRRKLGSELINL